MKKSNLRASLLLTAAELAEQHEIIGNMQAQSRIDEHRISKLKTTIQYLLNSIAIAMAGTPPEASSYFWEALFGSEVATMIDMDIEQECLALARATVKSQLGITDGASEALVETRKVVLEKINASGLRVVFEEGYVTIF